MARNSSNPQEAQTGYDNLPCQRNAIRMDRSSQASNSSEWTFNNLATAQTSRPVIRSRENANAASYRTASGQEDTDAKPSLSPETTFPAIRGPPAFSFGTLFNATPRPSPEPSLQRSKSPDSDFSLSPSPTPQALNLSPSSHLNSESRLSTGTVDPDDSSPLHASSGRPRTTAPVFHFQGPTASDTPSTSIFDITLRGGRSNEAHGYTTSLSGDLHPAELVPNQRIPYDPINEALPSGSFFDQQFQKALKYGTCIARDMTTALDEYLDASPEASDLAGFRERVKKSAEFRSTDERVVAVIGDSGQGKSTLVNALLHCSDLAQTGATGEACTSVVTEYHHKKPSQTAPFHIEVVHLSEGDVKDMVRELVFSFWRPNLIDPQTQDTDQLDDLEKFEREADVAESALRAAFGHYEAFQTVLDDRSEDAQEDMTGQFLDWAERLEWPGGSESGLWKASVDTALECSEKAMMFMTSKLSPFTKVIRIYLSAQILKTGIVLADLPGLHDVNLARVQASERYMLQCDHILVVANISRAVSDSSLKSVLFRNLARHMPHEWEENAGRNLNVTIICSNSEVPDEQEKSLRNTFFSSKQPIEQAKIEQIDADIKKAKGAGNGALKKQLKLKRKVILMDARSNFVIQGLQRSFANKTNGGYLEVMCVASAFYHKYWPKGNDKMVLASGIPALRRRCHLISADVQFREAKNLLLAVLPGLLNSIKLWVEANETTRSTEAPEEFDTEAIEASKAKLRKDVHDALGGAKREYELNIKEQIYDFVPPRSPAWEKAALNCFREWTYWHWKTFDAFCRNYGTHSTAKATARWNNELIWKMREELRLSWDSLEEETETCMSDIQSSTRASLDELKELVPAPLFKDSVDFHLTQLGYQFDVLERKFRKNIKSVRRTAEEDNDSSYVLKVMLPAYRRAAAERGPGMSLRQRHHIEAPIRGLFANMAVLIERDMARLVEDNFRETSKKLDEELDVVFQDLQHTVQMLVRERVEEPPEIVFPVEALEEWERRVKEVEAMVKAVGNGRRAVAGTPEERLPIMPAMEALRVS